MVVHAYNPNTLGGSGGRIACDQEFKTSQGNILRPYIYKKLKNQLYVVVHAYGPSYSEGWTWVQQFEAVANYDCALVLYPGWQSGTLSLRKEKKEFS